MGSGQFITNVVFNSSIDPTLLTVTRLDSAPPTVNAFNTHAAQDMDGGAELKAGLFNMHIDFAPPSGTSVFNAANGVVIYKFVGAGLDSSDFMMQSAPGGSGYLGTTYRMAAKIQGIPGDLSGSIGVATPIPEPETYAMLLAGLGLLGFAARRRKLKLAA
jgi:PEP-CTERM motif